MRMLLRQASFLAFGICVHTARAEAAWVAASADASVVAIAEGLAKAREPTDALIALGLLESLAPSVEPRVLASWRPPQAFVALRGDATAKALLVHDVARVACRIKHDCAVQNVPPAMVLGPIRSGGPPFDPTAPIVLTKSYDMGDYRAAFRPSPAGSRAPLALMVAPRPESCSWVLRQVQVDSPQALGLVTLAAPGQVALFVDGREVARDDEAHDEAIVSRIAIAVGLQRGPHQLLAKVCSTTRNDSGQVNLDLLPQAGEASSWQWTDPRKGLPTPSVSVSSKTNQSLLRSALSRGAEKSHAWAESMLRITLGADDSRRPRAPGLSSAVLESARGSLDERILLAANLPSPIWRSGWTSKLARDAKLTAAQREYLRRRAIEQHLSAGQVDWAIAESRAASFTKLTDQEARVLRAAALAATKEVPMQRLAARELDNTDLSDVAALLALELGPAIDRPLAEKALARVSRLVPTPAALKLSAHVDARRAVAIVRHALAAGELDGGEATALAETLSELGSGAEVANMLDEMAALMPNSPRVWSGYGRVLDAQHRTELHARAMARALALSPADTQFASAKAQRPVERDERYLTDPREGLPSRKGYEPGVTSRELFWTRAVTMNDDRRVSQLIHYAREIVIAPRTTDELEEELPFESDTLEILRARVHHKDGSVAFPIEERHDAERPRLKWAELVAGDTVEVAVRVRTKKPVGGKSDAPFYFVDYGGSTLTKPLLRNDVILDVPRGAPLHAEVRGAVDERTETDEGDRHITRLSWKRPPLVADEPLAPQMSELVPVVVASTFASWDAFRRWYKDAVVGFTEPDAEVRALAKSIVNGKVSQLDQIAALFKYVADHIRYVNYVSAEQWLPNRPQEVLARREGDCDDKAVLLIALLKAIGVDAREVLVQTRMTAKPTVLDGKAAVVPMFDHGIAYVPSLDLYLDATSPQSRLGVLPSMDGQAPALRLDDGPAELVRLPQANPKQHGSDVSWRVELTREGDAMLDARESYFGDSAFYMRTYLGEAAQRVDYVAQGLLAPWFPTSHVTGSVTFDGEREKGGATLQYAARLTGAARRQGSVLVVPLGPSGSLVSDLAPLAVRTLPVVVPPSLAPSSQRRQLTFVAPAGSRWSALPLGGTVEHAEFGRASFVVVATDRELVVTRELELRRDRISVADYPSWRAWLTNVDALLVRTAQLIQATP